MGKGSKLGWDLNLDEWMKERFVYVGRLGV